MDPWIVEAAMRAGKQDQKWNPRGRTLQSTLEANQMNSCRSAKRNNIEYFFKERLSFRLMGKDNRLQTTGEMRLLLDNCQRFLCFYIC
jgi:hypothetical protein